MDDHQGKFLGQVLTPHPVWYRVNCLGAGGFVSPFSDPAKGFVAPEP